MVDLLSEYPTQSVADHEVFMSFNNDSDARLFREWWEKAGSIGFDYWLSRKRPQKKAERLFEPCCECGEDYPRADLINDGEVFCPKCREVAK